MKLSGAVSVAVVFVLTAGIAYGQGAKTGPAKPMPGQGAKIGTPYKLGAKGQELHFTLEKAEFATRFFIDTDTVQAPPDHRLLIITFAVQNPATVDRQFDSSSFKFTVVSPDDENFTVVAPIVHPDRRSSLGLSLKPAQKVRAIAYVSIHPQGPVNKLIVERGTGNPVLRYDLHDQVKPLESAFATDKGLGSANQGLAVLKVPFELGPFDWTVDSIEEVPGWGDFNPGDGKKVVVVHMILSNVSMIKWWSSGEMQPKAYDGDGNDVPYGAILKNSTDENFFTNPDAGANLKFRILFYVPAATKLQKIVFNDSSLGRSVMLPLAIPGNK